MIERRTSVPWKRWRGRGPLRFAVAAATALPALAALPASAAEPPQAGDRPYARLFSQVTEGRQIRTVIHPGNGRERRLADLAKWYVHVETNGKMMGDNSRGDSETTLAEELAGREMLVSFYRNGSSTRGMGEAASIETEAPLAIGTWWPGWPRDEENGSASTASRLFAAVDADIKDTTIEVVSARENKPTGAKDTWPFLRSRRRGALPRVKGKPEPRSSNSRDFVSWVRVDDEIMRVRKVADKQTEVRLRVDRGYFGTQIANHEAGARVFAPTYIGNTQAAESDKDAGGSPAENNPARPLRYALKVWEPGALDWLRDRIVPGIKNGDPTPSAEGYNAVWLDITTCGNYNNAAADRAPVTQWDDPNNTQLGFSQAGTYHGKKIDALAARLRPFIPGFRFTANNQNASAEFQIPCKNRFLANKNLAVGSLESWLQNGKWATSMAQSFAIQADNLPALYWAKWGPNTYVPAYKRFTYGSYLLSYHRSADKTDEYGTTFELKRPDQLYFWDWGDPAPLDDPPTLAGLIQFDMEKAGTVYARRYQHGLVMVNPTDTPVECTLDGTYYNVSETDKDLQPPPPQVSTTEIGTKDAAFLMNPTSTAGTLACSPQTE